MKDVQKIRAGLYRHEPTGLLIVATTGQYSGVGPRGGDVRGWEHARLDGRSFVIDSPFVYPTLREAVAALGQQQPGGDA